MLFKLRDYYMLDICYSNDACRMSGQTRRFKDSRFTGDDDEEEIDGCVAGTAGNRLRYHVYEIYCDLKTAVKMVIFR